MTQILRPGFLVSLKTAIRGGIAYVRTELDPGEAPAPEADVARWETTRTIEDRDEHARAVDARAKASSAVRRVCLATSFGLLCPLSREEELEAAIASARGIVDTFNGTAEHSRVEVFILRGRIAETDEEATRAIANEVRGLLDTMESGVRNLDVGSVREAANKARELAAALDAKSGEKMREAIDAARTAARAIVRRVEKAGEEAADVLRELNLGPIASARFAFLELEQGAAVESSAPAVAVQRFAEIELDGPDAPSSEESSTAPARAIELGDVVCEFAEERAARVAELTAEGERERASRAAVLLLPAVAATPSRWEV